MNHISGRKGDEMALLKMHNETMGVLKDINENIGRLANSQEAFLNNLCQNCALKNTGQNFHDYFKRSD